MTLEHSSKNWWYALAALSILLLAGEKKHNMYWLGKWSLGLRNKNLCCRLSACSLAVVQGKEAGMLCCRLLGTLGNLSDVWKRKSSFQCPSASWGAIASEVYSSFLQRLMFGKGWSLAMEGITRCNSSETKENKKWHCTTRFCHFTLACMAFINMITDQNWRKRA